MNKNLFPIAKEGVKPIIIAFGSVLLLLILDFDILALAGSFILLFLIFSFRNPERSLPEFSDGSVLSVSDGVVTSITELNDPIYSYKVEVESGLFDIGILRTPFNAISTNLIHINGTKVSKKSKLFLDLNETVEVVFEDVNKNKIKLTHRVKQNFLSLYWKDIKSENLRQTTRYGMLINGVTTLYFPRNFRLNVSIGNKIKASESLMGYFS